MRNDIKKLVRWHFSSFEIPINLSALFSSDFINIKYSPREKSHISTLTFNARNITRRQFKLSTTRWLYSKEAEDERWIMMPQTTVYHHVISLKISKFRRTRYTSLFVRMNAMLLNVVICCGEEQSLLDIWDDSSFSSFCRSKTRKSSSSDPSISTSSERWHRKLSSSGPFMLAKLFYESS